MAELHPGQLDISTAEVVAALEEHPDLASRPLREVATGGTQNRLFRLGDDLAVRVPLLQVLGQVLEKEARWIPLLAPRLPLAVPEPVRLLPPTDGLPAGALVQRWLPGDDADRAPPRDLAGAARTLADLIAAFASIPVPADAPRGSRGGPLAEGDARFQAALAEVRERGLADADRAGAVWAEGRDAPAWDGPAVWLHGDIIPANLLTTDGRLSGLIDFGCLSVGDPAYDLIPAWFVLDAPARAAFRAATAPDDAMWARGRARVVWQSILALPYYLDTNPAMVRLARRGLAEALTEGSLARPRTPR